MNVVTRRLWTPRNGARRSGTNVGRAVDSNPPEHRCTGRSKELHRATRTSHLLILRTAAVRPEKDTRCRVGSMVAVRRANGGAARDLAKFTSPLTYERAPAASELARRLPSATRCLLALDCPSWTQRRCLNLQQYGVRQLHRPTAGARASTACAGGARAQACAARESMSAAAGGGTSAAGGSAAAGSGGGGDAGGVGGESIFTSGKKSFKLLNILY